MIIAIPDDYHGVVHGLDCFAKLAGHDVRIFRDVAPSPERLVANLRDAEIIVPVRERTRYTRELIGKLPKLKLFSQTGRSTRHIDVAACTERGIAIAAGTNASPYTVSEHTWALILASLRRIPQEAAHDEARRVAPVLQHDAARPHARHLRPGKNRQLVAATGASFGMRVLAWGQEGTRATAKAAGYDVAGVQAGPVRTLRRAVRAGAADPRDARLVTADDLARMKPRAAGQHRARRADRAGRARRRTREGPAGLAAVDVYENEPVAERRPPAAQARQRAVHARTRAWLEQHTYELYFGEAFDNILAFIAGTASNMVNPEALCAADKQ